MNAHALPSAEVISPRVRLHGVVDARARCRMHPGTADGLLPHCPWSQMRTLRQSERGMPFAFPEVCSDSLDDGSRVT